MFELLVIVIGVLVLAVLLLLARSRRSTGDPSSSVQDFNRALSAMEPGARGRTDIDTAGADAEDDEAAPAGGDPAGESSEERDRSSR